MRALPHPSRKRGSDLIKYTAVISETPSKFAVFHGPPEQTLRAAKDAGFDAVQLTARTADDLPAERLRALSAKLGIGYSAVATGQVASVDGLTMNASDEAARRACVGRICSIVSRAAEAGCAGFVVGMVRGDSRYAATQEASLASFERSLREVAAHVERIGVTAFVEVYNRLETNMYYDPEATRELLERIHSPNVRMSLDLTHLFTEGLDVPETIRAYAKYCYQIDVTGEDRVAPGASSMDFAAICAAIRDSGFDGYLNFEFSAPSPAEELAFVKALVEKN